MEEIGLTSYIGVDKNMKYKDRAELLVKKAIDGKVTVFGIESLIGAGADVLSLNIPFSNNYYHEVIYKEKTFNSFTERPVVYIIDQSLK